MGDATQQYYHIVSYAELRDTPSHKDGVSDRTEEEQRAYGCDLIKDVGLLLGFHVGCMARAQVLLQRLYFVVSLKQFDVVVAATVCLWTASKLDDCQVKFRVLLAAVYKCLQRRGGVKKLKTIDTASRDYHEVKQLMVEAERKMLHNISLSVHHEPVHCHLLLYCTLLQLGDDYSTVPQTAWDILSDSYRSNIHCRFPGNIIAVSAIYLSLRKHRSPPLPEDWHTLFDTSSQDLVECSKALASIYTWKRPEYRRYRGDVKLHAVLRV